MAGEYAKEERQTNHEQRNIVHSSDPGLMSGIPCSTIEWTIQNNMIIARSVDHVSRVGRQWDMWPYLQVYSITFDIGAIRCISMTSHCRWEYQIVSQGGKGGTSKSLAHSSQGSPLEGRAIKAGSWRICKSGTAINARPEEHSLFQWSGNNV